MSQTSRDRSRSANPVIALVITIAMTAVFFVLLEGVSSTLLGIYRASQSPESYHDYDEVIGWTARRNIFYPDFFGPGKYIRINGQGFREDSDSAAAEPDGKARILCSGDSFTFGQGVANDETWCHQLVDFLPNVDPVNLGQSGYGVDQSYLWYMRAGRELQHRAHVFAFIGADLARMSVRSNWDTGKPVLQLVGNEIEVANFPVPRVRHWLARKIKAADLRVVTLGGKILSRLKKPISTDPHQTPSDATREVARRVFEELVAVTANADRETLFVYLPTEQDIAKDSRWHDWTREVMVELQYPFLDLTPAMRQLPASNAAGFFIAGGEHAGHYTYEGNRWVAEMISRELEKKFQISTDAPNAQ